MLVKLLHLHKDISLHEKSVSFKHRGGIVVTTFPFVRFMQLPGRAEQHGLLGFSLSFLQDLLKPRQESNSRKSTSVDEALNYQIRLINAFWSSGIAAWDLRFIKTSQRPDIEVNLFCRLCYPQYLPMAQFHHYYLASATRIQQLFASFGYDLQPLIHASSFNSSFEPFPFHALAEVRRYEEVLSILAARTEYETYATYPWTWNTQQRVHVCETLSRLPDNALISICLEPTQVTSEERELLNHAASNRSRNMLESIGPKGQRIYEAYTDFSQSLQQPYLLRIAVAATSPQSLEQVGRALLDEINSSQAAGTGALLQYPQNHQERQCLYYSLQHLAWIPWGNLRAHTPDTARLRYLVDDRSASIAFRLPIRSDSVNQKIKVLLVFANPHGTDPVRLGQQDRVIREAVKLSRYRDNIELTSCHAATIHDLRRTLLEDTFHIVHISGHGSREGLILENENGTPFVVPPKALANLFGAYRNTVHCVLLNACYGIRQGELISLGIPYTIAMDGQISDFTAMEFARGFYDAIGAGRGIDFAYEEGCRSVELSMPNAMFPSQLLKMDSPHPPITGPATEGGLLRKRQFR
jgi:CHAT domain